MTKCKHFFCIKLLRVTTFKEFSIKKEKENDYVNKKRYRIFCFDSLLSHCIYNVIKVFIYSIYSIYKSIYNNLLLLLLMMMKIGTHNTASILALSFQFRYFFKIFPKFDNLMNNHTFRKIIKIKIDVKISFC